MASIATIKLPLAEEAAAFYTSVFPNSTVHETTRYVEGGPRPAGQAMTVRFVLDGTEFLALNGGPEFSFNEAVSFVVAGRDQAEIDRYWDRLREGGGKEGRCGWLKDRFGLSWEVVPADMAALSGTEKAQNERASLDGHAED